MPERKRRLTPWGKEVKMRMLALDISAKDLVRAINDQGITFDRTKLSRIISGEVGQKSPELIAAIDSILEIPDDIPGRPA